MTRFPARPVASPRFLIGSGTNCHLQLGGDFPMLHSVVMRTSDGWEIEAIAVEPDLSVNGHKTRRCRLHAGDHVQVGPFQFHWETDAVFRGAGRAPETADSLQNT